MSTNVASIEIPDGMRLHTENTSNILLDANEAFLNPVQEFNRDLSVACITVWSEELNRVKEERWKKAQERKANHKKVQKKAKSMSTLLQFRHLGNNVLLAVSDTAADSKVGAPETSNTASVPSELTSAGSEETTAGTQVREVWNKAI